VAPIDAFGDELIYSPG